MILEGLHRNALTQLNHFYVLSILDLDPEKSLKSQQAKEEVADTGPPLKDDPKYAKVSCSSEPAFTFIFRDVPNPQSHVKHLVLQYFKMLKMGLPMGAVKNAMVRDELDPKILDMDPEKSLASQTGESADTGPPMKEDPKYAKYFKMIKMGLPMGAVKNALIRDGLDPALMDLDHNKSVASQLDPKKKGGPKGLKPSKPKIRRKKVYWNKIDAKDGNVWTVVKKLEVKLEVEMEEFERLFSQALDAQKEKEKKDAKASSKKPTKGVKVIE